MIVLVSIVASGLLGAPAAMANNGVPTPAHIVVVMEENHSYNEIIGSSSAPYINSLANAGALFTQSFAITHPSEPNYLAPSNRAIAGSRRTSIPMFSGQRPTIAC